MGVGLGWVEMTNVTGFEAILRISVAKLVISFLEYEALLGNLGHFTYCFLTGGGRWVNCIKKRTDRQYEAGAPV